MSPRCSARFSDSASSVNRQLKCRHHCLIHVVVHISVKPTADDQFRNPRRFILKSLQQPPTKMAPQKSRASSYQGFFHYLFHFLLLIISNPSIAPVSFSRTILIPNVANQLTVTDAIDLRSLQRSSEKHFFNIPRRESLRLQTLLDSPDIRLWEAYRPL